MRAPLVLTKCLLASGIHAILSTSLVIRQGDAKLLPLIFNETADSLQQVGKEAADGEKNFVNEVLQKVKPQDSTFENTIAAYWQNRNALSQLTAKIYLYANIGDYPDLTAPSRQARGTYEDALDNTFKNKQFYELVHAVYTQYYDSEGAPSDKKQWAEDLDAEDLKILKVTWHWFVDGGLNLKPEEQDRLKTISDSADDVESAFMDALGNITAGTPLYFTRKELSGVPDDRIAKLAKDNAQDGDKYAVTIDDLDIVSQCNNATTRQAVWLQGNRLVPENIDRLKQTIALRAEQANLLGYPSYATYALQDTLIANPENVRSFIDQIDVKLQPLNQEQYIGILKGLKKEEEGSDDLLFEWDQDYYESKAKAAGMRKRQSKEPNSSEYYEAIGTINRMLDVLSPVFHFRFEKLSADTAVPGHSAKDVVWEPNVQLYAVYDTDDNSPVGHLYVDPYHRDSDDALASTAYTISPGSSFVNSDGTRNPISVIVKYYFDAPNEDRPTLLSSDQLHLLFRLFGSVLSSFSGKVKYNALSAISSAIPSDYSNVIQSTLEGWSNDPQTLERISEHWSYASPEALQAWQKANANQPQPPKHIPQDTPAKGKDSSSSGLANGHNVWFALYSASVSAWDQYLYGQSHPVDTASLDLIREFKRISKQYRKLDHIGDTGVTDISKWDYPFTFDSHNVQTPGSVYDYSFSWLYAADLFSRFQDDPFSTSIGGQFRDLLLAPGASRDYEAQIEMFLGRKLEFGKYLATLGVHEASGVA